jgi:hypothetical protein
MGTASIKTAISIDTVKYPWNQLLFGIERCFGYTG